MSLETTIQTLGAASALEVSQKINEAIGQLEELKATLYIRQKSTAYALGNMVQIPGKGNYDKLLKCTTAGTTSSADIDYSGITLASTFTDGTAGWTCVPRLDTTDTTIISNMISALTSNTAFTTLAQSVCHQPPGSVIAFAGAIPPSDFLLCDGAAVSRTTYSALFTAIGTTYGTGDGSSTFNVPDFRGYFLRGLGGASAALGTAQPDDFKSHSHSGVVGTTATAGGPDGVQQVVVGHENIGSTGGTETRPKNFAVNWIIKY